MSDNQDITTNAQTADDQDVEGHVHVQRSGDGTVEDALGPQGVRAARNDAPDGEDDVEGHMRMARSDDGESDALLGPEGRII